MLEITGGSIVKVRDVKMVGMNLPDRYVVRVDSSEAAFDNVTIGLSSGGVYAISGGPTISIRNSTILHGFSNVQGNVTIDESTFLDSSLGIFLVDSMDSNITNSVFVSSRDDSLSIEDPVNSSLFGRSLVANNTFVGGGIFCELGTPAVKTRFFDSNVISNTTVTGTSGTCHYDYNLLSPTGTLAGTGNITGDPLFVNAPGHDFHLRAGSPAIDAADPAPLTPNTHDHDGKLRPQGARSDIGAFEYHP